MKLFLCIVGAILSIGLACYVYAQDLAGPYGVTSTMTVVQGQPLATSVRYSHQVNWFTDLNPPDGGEGTFGMPTDDPNHVMVWHMSHWRFLSVTTSIQ